MLCFPQMTYFGGRAELHYCRQQICFYLGHWTAYQGRVRNQGSSPQKCLASPGDSEVPRKLFHSGLTIVYSYSPPGKVRRQSCSLQPRNRRWWKKKLRQSGRRRSLVWMWFCDPLFRAEGLGMVGRVEETLGTVRPRGSPNPCHT